jgi:hypothetical protein
MLEAIYRSGMITDGLGTIRADELHSYEEGINSHRPVRPAELGQPKRAGAADGHGAALSGLTEVNAAGHRHFLSNYFPRHDFSSRGRRGVPEPPNFLILHPGMLLVQYNGSPRTRDMILQNAGRLPGPRQDRARRDRRGAGQPHRLAYGPELHRQRTGRQHSGGLGAAQQLLGGLELDPTTNTLARCWPATDHGGD